MYEWGYLFKALAQIVLVTIVICVLAVIIKSTIQTLRKKDQ